MVKVVNPHPSSAAPIFYADQPAGMAFSPQVTRLSFGVNDDDDESEFPRPVVTVVMPTDAVITMVRDLMDVLDNDVFKDEMIAKTAHMAQYFSEGLQREVSGTMFRVGKEPTPKVSRKKIAK